MKKKLVKHYIAVRPEYMQEEFKGEIVLNPVRFPKELGEEHPFPFEDAEKLYIRYGLVAECINKIAENIVGDFSVSLDNENAQALIDKFFDDTNCIVIMKEWVAEALLKGNGYIELDLENNQLRTLNANNIYIKAGKKGKILMYHQWFGNFKYFSLNSRKLIPFTPERIAHLPINKLPGSVYGLGIVWQNERIIDNMIQNENDLQKLITRKAGMPIWVKLGAAGEAVSSDSIDAFSNKLKYMTNKTEWVTDGNTDIKPIDFRGITNNSIEGNMYWFRQFIAGVGMPEVLFGSGQLNEGIAKVQLESYRMKIHSIRRLVEEVVEDKIIRPVLNANGFDEDPEFVWEMLSDEQKNERLLKLKELLALPQLSPEMRASLEIELARTLDLEVEDILPSPEEARDEYEKDKEMMRKEFEAAGEKKEPFKPGNKEKEKESKIKQPEVPGAKPRAKEMQEAINFSDMTVREFVNLQEQPGFNYINYMVNIMRELKVYKFEYLRAITESDEAVGLLPEKDIEKLRIILKNGFIDNKTMRQIEKDIKDNIPLKDRITENRVIPAEQRPEMIARTETLTIANIGLIDTYEQAGVKKVRWLAALSDRTCPECESLNGTIMTNDEYLDKRSAIHPMCRCSCTAIFD